MRRTLSRDIPKRMNPVLLNIPMPIKTPRLLMRPPQAGDGPELNAAILESWEEIKDWLPFVKQGKPTLENSEENVRRAFAKWVLREDLRVSMWDIETGKFAGSTGLHRINWELPAFEIGYWVRTSFAGKGLISEAVNALTRFAFQELKAKRVELRCDPNNAKSIAVAEKMGYRREGLLKNQSTHPQTFEVRDTIVFSRTDSMGLPDLDVR